MPIPSSPSKGGRRHQGVSPFIYIYINIICLIIFVTYVICRWQISDQSLTCFVFHPGIRVIRVIRVLPFLWIHTGWWLALEFLDFQASAGCDGRCQETWSVRFHFCLKLSSWFWWGACECWVGPGIFCFLAIGIASARINMINIASQVAALDGCTACVWSRTLGSTAGQQGTASLLPLLPFFGAPPPSSAGRFNPRQRFESAVGSKNICGYLMSLFRIKSKKHR
jgi:hypothetical protein